MQSRNIRFQISDFRFQISDSDTRGREADFFGRSQILDLRSPRGTRAEISKGSRILNAQNTFQDFVPDFCATQISDFRSQNWPRFLISDFRHRISDPRKPATPRQRFRFQKTDFKGAGPDPTGFRFQISDLSAEQADVASPLQMSECRIQIPGTKKYLLEGPRRRPDNIGQIPMEKMLSPVLRTKSPRTLGNREIV